MIKKCFSANLLKYIAITAMTLDHIAWHLLTFESTTSQVFHFLGRLTAPIMCFFIVEGYIHTRSVKKYALRLLLFGIISQIPWVVLNGNLTFNMMFTLLLCLCAVYVCDKIKNIPLRFILIFLLVCLSLFCDWYVFGVLWTVVFYIFKNDEKKKYLYFSIVSLLYFINTLYNSFLTYAQLQKAFILSLYSLGVFISVLLLLMYNGKKGKFKQSKWVFYIYYPAHLLVIALIAGVI